MNVQTLVIHHSASSQTETTVAQIQAWHKQRGFSQIGYHKVILGNGAIKAGRSETIMGAHAKGANKDSLGVCLTGNFENDTPTAAQINSLVSVLANWCRTYRLKENSIYGHYNVPGGATATACPGKNLKSQFKTIKEGVKKQLPKYAIEMQIKDKSLQRTLRKALADDGRLSFDEVKELLASTLDGDGVSRQEHDDLKVILANSKTIDTRSRALVDTFLAHNYTPKPTQPSPASGGQLTTNFHRSEFDCNDGTLVPASLMDNVREVATNLQVLRDQVGKPITVNSGYRTVKHNKAVGGVSNSQHLKAKAADIKVKGMTPVQVKAQILSLIGDGKMKQGGIGLYNTFVHYDVRGTKARW